MTGERIGEGLGHPHSILDIDGTLAYCESSTASVVVGGSRSEQLPGYPRGLCRVGDRLLVGTSRGRKVSKSTGITNRADPGAPAGRCSVTTLALPGLAIERVDDLDELALEIYDLQPVSDAAAWPVVAETEWLKSRLVGLQERYEEHDGTVTWLHTEVAARDAEIVRLHSEVARRDASIAELQRDVADRDERLRMFAR
jgi:hypothetical protein